MSRFEISEGKGFHMTFSNNWHISVQFGRGNLCSRQDTEHYKGDLILKLMEKEYQIEVKARKDGFKTIHQFLKSNDILALKANNKPFLLVFEIDKFIEIVKEYQNGCNQQLSTLEKESN